MFDWRLARPLLHFFPLTSTPSTSVFPAKTFYRVSKSNRVRATYLPQNPSTSESVFNLKTNYELFSEN